MKTVETDRLVLRAGREDDWEATWSYRRLPEVAVWLTELPTDPGAYRATFVEPDRLKATVVVERDGVIIGDFMLRIEDAWAQTEVADQAKNKQAELGWVLDPAHTGRGYATEAARALIQYAFNDLGVRRLHANSFIDNDASWRLMERLGMRCEQHAVRDSFHRSGEWLDTVTYALLANDV